MMEMPSVARSWEQARQVVEVGHEFGLRWLDTALAFSIFSAPGFSEGPLRRTKNPKFQSGVEPPHSKWVAFHFGHQVLQRRGRCGLRPVHRSFSTPSFRLGSSARHAPTWRRVCDAD